MDNNNVPVGPAYFVRLACTSPRQVSMYGTFIEAVSYLIGFHQGLIIQAGVVAPEAQRWQDLYDRLMAQYGGTPGQPMSAYQVFRARFASDGAALAELLRIYEEVGHSPGISGT